MLNPVAALPLIGLIGASIVTIKLARGGHRKLAFIPIPLILSLMGLIPYLLHIMRIIE